MTTLDANTGWVALAGQLVGNPTDWSMSWNWDHIYHPSTAEAIKAGLDGRGAPR